MELSSIEGAQIVRALDLATYQLEQLVKEVGSHDRQIEELSKQLGEVKVSLALMAASKTRSDLSIAALPDYLKKTDYLFDSQQRMQNNLDTIKNQTWGAFLSAIAVMIASWVWQAQGKPAKAAINEAGYHLAHHADPIASLRRKL